MIVNGVCGFGSTGRICTDLADVLSEQGHECKITYGRESVHVKYQKYAARIVTNFDVNMHSLESRIFDKVDFGRKKATERFIDGYRSTILM